MRLQLKDQKATVITHKITGQQIKRAASFDEDREEYFYFIHVNGKELRYYGNNQQSLSQKDFNKLIRKGFEKASEPAYISEQEQAHWEAVASDCDDESKHGHKVFSVIDSEGNGGVYVWDYYQQKTVRQSELTQLTFIK